MSRRFGKKRVPNCECTHRFTCRPCLEAAVPTGLPQGTHTRCQWFANCSRAAVTTVQHPVLGGVPCCQKCADFARG
jgi:hypothetical protein